MTETTWTTDTGTWGYTASGTIWCTTCDGETHVVCDTCHGNTCDCDRPACAVCADPATECAACDNTGRQHCPTCES